MKWTKQTIHIPHQNRYITAIVDSEGIILDCALFSDSLIEWLIDKHNSALSYEYHRGLMDGAGIKKGCRI